MINTYNLFAVTVIHGKFVVPINIHKKILKYAEENYISKDSISCRSGFQKYGDFDGKKELDKELNMYLNNIFKLNIEYSWLNVLGENSHNNPHRHPGSTTQYAGVLYLSSENSNITFTKDSEIFEIKPKLFEYLIFPDDLVHYVLPEKRNEKRISYAFNMSTIEQGEKNGWTNNNN